MEDFGILLDSHDCTAGRCSRRTHTQLALVSPEDVGTAGEEIRMLAGVRDRLMERGYRMLETEPTPQFEPMTNNEPKPWAVRFDAAAPAWPMPTGTETRTKRFGFLRTLW